MDQFNKPLVPRWCRILALALGLAAAGWVVGDAGRASGQAVGDLDRAAIRAVIEDQIAAFRRDDAEAAFAHASPQIRRQFLSASNFMAMVQSGYAPVYRPRRVEFQILENVDGVWTQRLKLIDRDGRPYLAFYAMQRQPDGSWRINGVVLVRIPSADI